jgi:hypothetical protein
MTWQQIYDPFGNWIISTIVASLPVLTLFFVLVVLKKRVWVSALCGFIAAVAIALLVLKMPVALIAAAAGHGMIYAVLRITWIIVASIFLYNIAVETGQFQVMKDSIAGLSSDKRLQLVLIAFCFGAFLEGTGGGGAPVAIAGAFLIGLGFQSFQSAVLCLVANTAPVAWGGVGNPIRTLAAVTGLPELSFSAMTGRILPPLSIILPLWLVRSMVGWRETIQVRHAILLVELSGRRLGRCHRRIVFVAGDGRVSQVLEAQRNHSSQRPTRRAYAATFFERSAERLVAVYRRFGFDFCDGLACDCQTSEFRFAQNADAAVAQCRAENAARRPASAARRSYRQSEFHQRTRHGGVHRSHHRRAARGLVFPPHDGAFQNHRYRIAAFRVGDQFHGWPRVRHALFGA